MTKNRKKCKRAVLPEPAWGDERSFDCGLGLYLTKNAEKICYGLPEDLRDNFDKFYDSLVGPYPNIYEVRATPGYYTYNDGVLQILYYVEKCWPPDFDCFFTIQEITLI